MKWRRLIAWCLLAVWPLVWGGAQAAGQESRRDSGNPGGFDLATGTVALNSGYVMPLNGLGTYSLHGEECISAVKAALQCGVRLIDTASAYGNEAEVGQAIRESMEELGIAREEFRAPSRKARRRR